jgi:hypothetical protein
MLRTISVCEKNVAVEPPRVIMMASEVATELFPSEVGLRPIGGETFTREVQNATGGDLYLSFSVSGANGVPSCDNLYNWHILIADAQIYNIPDCVRVCGYSLNRGKVSCIRRYRIDLTQVN